MSIFVVYLRLGILIIHKVMGQQARLIDWKWKQERINRVYWVHTHTPKRWEGRETEKEEEATINRNQISDAFVYLIRRRAENIHSTFLHFFHHYDYYYCWFYCFRSRCCWFCLLFLYPQTESINFQFFPFRNDLRCIFYLGFSFVYFRFFHLGSPAFFYGLFIWAQ